MRMALGQFNAVVGDLAGNAAKIRDIYTNALAENVDLLVLPELAVCGYPPEDLLLMNHFLEECKNTVEKLAADCPEKTIIIGFAEGEGNRCYNSAAVLQNGKVKQVYRKAVLVNCGVFDERRYFSADDNPAVIEVDGINIALTICADIWNTERLEKNLKNQGRLNMILNISASPFHIGKFEKRKETVIRCAKKFAAVVAYCNLVGGQDELIFDGRSMMADADGRIVCQAKAFDEDLLIADITADKKNLEIKQVSPVSSQPADRLDEVYQALVLGTRDYTRKNGFEKVLLGLSGGLDSSVTACIAAAALGPENVTGITMPSKFNSPETIADAEKLAKNLGIEFHTIPVESVLARFDKSLQTVEGWDKDGIAYENLQARIRGTILMSLSNKSGAIVLTSGNKSETAVGYATLYGDTAGGFAVIKDVLKTTVYKLADYINKLADRPLIPAEVINRPPSAELKKDQKDADVLGDYELLDEILKGYVEQDKSAEQLIAQGLPAEQVRRIIDMVNRSEYKRRQSPPGIKITPKAFGKDRRLPITNRYRPQL